MKVALLVAPKQFRDESVSHSLPMLEKWGVSPTLVSYSTHDCVGYRGAVYKVGLNGGKLHPDDFDAIILVDGPGVDTYKLYDFRPLLDIMKLFAQKGKLIATVGNAVKIIARANIITGVKIATPRDEESRRLVVLYRGVESDKHLELDKNIMTLNDGEKIEEMTDMLLGKLGAK
ncbi:MAG: DJ-1/PfpI family protein [Candidatus Micrarchaeota archaeon]|nr:DJ-1/PfpI family protein [Candidatus Micrarchaeota archaeon]MDE1849153.1 DJ-1/PfpI family protein [Candidatus Micrarchaeota archaeon]